MVGLCVLLYTLLLLLLLHCCKFNPPFLTSPFLSCRRRTLCDVISAGPQAGRLRTPAALAHREKTIFLSHPTAKSTVNCGVRKKKRSLRGSSRRSSCCCCWQKHSVFLLAASERQLEPFGEPVSVAPVKSQTSTSLAPLDCHQ